MVSAGKKRSFAPDGAYDTRSNKRSRTSSDINAYGGQSLSEGLGNTISISNFPAKNKLYHPLNAINDLLFSQVPEAHIAFTHESTFFKATGLKYDIEGLQKFVQEQYVVEYYKETKVCTLEGRLEIIPLLKSSSFKMRLTEPVAFYTPLPDEGTFSSSTSSQYNPHPPPRMRGRSQSLESEGSSQSSGSEGARGPSTLLG
ncbi:hypothetical protein BDQ17DRAFT_845825 [Cyathus striatus]|nr:hypothetical protein BDQ17DRAFT_845825 [Cyathus striatus]